MSSRQLIVSHRKSDLWKHASGAIAKIKSNNERYAISKKKYDAQIKAMQERVGKQVLVLCQTETVRKSLQANLHDARELSGNMPKLIQSIEEKQQKMKSKLSHILEKHESVQTLTHKVRGTLSNQQELTKSFHKELQNFQERLLSVSDLKINLAQVLTETGSRKAAVMTDIENLQKKINSLPLIQKGNETEELKVLVTEIKRLESESNKVLSILEEGGFEAEAARISGDLLQILCRVASVTMQQELEKRNGKVFEEMKRAQSIENQKKRIIESYGLMKEDVCGRLQAEMEKQKISCSQVTNKPVTPKAENIHVANNLKRTPSRRSKRLQAINKEKKKRSKLSFTPLKKEIKVIEENTKEGECMPESLSRGTHQGTQSTSTIKPNAKDHFEKVAQIMIKRKTTSNIKRRKQRKKKPLEKDEMVDLFSDDVFS